MTGVPVGRCPKAMVHGPCGGVRCDGGCEVDAALPCPFVPAPVTTTALRAAPVPLRLGAGTVPGRPLILADIPVPLQGFAGMVTPPGLLDRVLAAADPWTTGVAAATAFAEEVLAVPGVAGVDLSGVTTRGEEPTLAAAMTEVARRLR